MRPSLFALFAVLTFVAASFRGRGQDCTAGQVYTHEAFLYGRFEVGMRSAPVSGVVSSFFLYNLDLGCNWPAENNEIDIEMLGNGDDVLFTTHYPGPWHVTDVVTPSPSPHDAISHYAIEWEPGIVRWFIDDSLVVIHDHEAIQSLVYPMRIMMNLWAVDNPNWAGIWDPSSMPVESSYDYVRCYAYTPGSGSHGTNQAFSLLWSDSFDSLSTQRWAVEEFGGFTGNFCSFESTAHRLDSGRLFLEIEAPTSHPAVPVTFHVDANYLSTNAIDRIYLNGSFNNWCGTCMEMSSDNDVWSITTDLSPGKYEYLFTLNNWQQNGSAPYQSRCDANPCDEWLNYGFTLPIGSTGLELDTVCWSTCEPCAPLSTRPVPVHPKVIVSQTDSLGRDWTGKSGQLILMHYSDGSVEKKWVTP
jgi:beta-glucanase (GH16 family)